MLPNHSKGNTESWKVGLEHKHKSNEENNKDLEPDFMSSWKPFRKSKPQDNMI
jgi:hypothetical protein